MTNESLKQNKLTYLPQILRGISLVLLFAFILIILFRLSSIFDVSRLNTANNKTEVVFGFTQLFDFTNQEYQSRNFVYLFNFAALFGAMIYGLYSAYRVLNRTNLFSLNLIYYAIFTLLATASFVLLAFFKISYIFDPLTLIYHSIPFLAIMIVSLVYEALNFMQNKKAAPTYLFNLSAPLVALIIRFILVAIGFVLLVQLLTTNLQITTTITTANGVQSTTTLAAISNIDQVLSLQNPFYLTLLSVSTAANPIALVSLILIIVALVIDLALMLYSYFSGPKRELRVRQLRQNFFSVVVASFLATVIYGLYNISGLGATTGVFGTLTPNYLAFSIVLGINLVLVITFGLIVGFKAKLKIANNILSFLFYGFMLLALASNLVLRLYNLDQINNYVNVIGMAVFGLIYLVIGYWKMPNRLKSTKFILGLVVLALTLATGFQALDLQMTASNNSILSSIYALLHISDLCLIIAIGFTLLIIIYQVYIWFKALYYISRATKLNKHLGGLYETK